TALNFLVTIITMRAPGMTFWRMPLLVWANFTTSLLVVLATPFIAGSQFFVMFDRVMHTHFFDPAHGGYVLGYQHIFWFYSHPAVYIMVLPGFGIISEVISVFSRKPIFGYRLMALSLLAILVLGFSGVYLGAVPIDIHVSDTYFIVAHIHYVLFGGSFFTIMAGVYYWFPKMTGRMYNEALGKLHFWTTFIAFNLTFFPMHLIGTRGMPRRVADYVPAFADWNLFISICSFVLGASIVIFFYNVIHSWKYGPPAPPNPWRAMTLEWQVTSP